MPPPGSDTAELDDGPPREIPGTARRLSIGQPLNSGTTLISSCHTPYRKGTNTHSQATAVIAMRAGEGEVAEVESVTV